jgi:hypothetical protein
MTYAKDKNLFRALPTSASCDQCGSVTQVPPQSIPEDSQRGQLRGFDQSWRAGYWFTFLCATCGRRKQRVSSTPRRTAVRRQCR